MMLELFKKVKTMKWRRRIEWVLIITTFPLSLACIDWEKV